METIMGMSPAEVTLLVEWVGSSVLAGWGAFLGYLVGLLVADGIGRLVQRQGGYGE